MDNIEKYTKQYLFDKYCELKLRTVIGQMKVRAEKDGIPFDMSVKDLKPFPLVCPVLGIEIDWFVQGSGPTDYSPSVDKTVPHLGYVAGNVRIISQKANRGKSNLSMEEIKKLCEYMKYIEDNK